MGHTAKAVANWFLDKSHPISPLKLQKLVYISHGWYMALSSAELLVDDEFAEAWEHGPVFPSLYHEFKEFGFRAITRKAEDFAEDFAPFHDWETTTPEIPTREERTHSLLEKIWIVYGKFSGGQLSSLTHAEGTPWHQIRTAYPGMRNIQIPNELIRKHYEEKASQNG